MKSLRLTAAILSVLTGGVLILVNVRALTFSWLGLSGILIGLGVAVIVLGALLFRDRRNLGIAISLLVLSLFLALIYTAGMGNGSYNELASIFDVYPRAVYYHYLDAAIAISWIILLSNIANVIVISFYLSTPSEYWQKDASGVSKYVGNSYLIDVSAHRSRVLKLVSAVLAFVVGAGLALVRISDSYGFYATGDPFFLLAVAVIVMGSLLFRNTRNKGIAVTLLVLSSVLAYLLFADTYYYYGSGAKAIRWLILAGDIAIVVIISIYLGMLKKVWPKNATVSDDINQPVAPVAAVAMDEEQSFVHNVVFLRKMKQAGTLTEKEYKTILAREIERFNDMDSPS